MKKIVLHGAYKGDNFGDTLLLLILISKLQDKGIQIILSNTCKSTVEKCKQFKNIRMAKGISELMFADCLIFGGGGYFGEQPTNKIKWYLNFIKNHLAIGYLFIIMRKPIAFIGVEFGELSNAFIKWLSCLLLNKAKILGARNFDSVSWLKDNVTNKNIVYSADMALNIKDFDFEGDCTNNSSEFEILMHPSFDPKLDSVSAQIVDCLNKINWENDSMKLSLILDRNNAETERLAASWRSALGDKISNIYKYESPLELCAIIKNSNCIISNKLHTTIVAASYGRRVISVAKHPKNKRFFNDIGRPDLYFSHNDFNEDAFEMLLGLLQKNELEPITLQEDVYNRARVNCQLVDDFLTIL